MIKTKIRTLLLDIESSPNIAYVWGKWEQNVLGDFIRERQIICFAWKWLDEKETHVLSLPRFPMYLKDRLNNKSLVQELHNIISCADIVIGHNLVQFDDKMANTDFIVNGFEPPPPHKTVDTLKVARSRFGFNSNKLDDLGARLKLGRKKKTGGFDLWVRCLAGEPDAWRTMEEYNRQDVVLLEKVYLKMRPWMINHPAVAYKESCPVCGSKNTQKSGFVFSKVGKKQRYKCRCGQWFCGPTVKEK